MKNFKYAWDKNYFLLHVQLNNDTQDEYEVTINRVFNDNEIKQEKILIPNNMKSHRFIVSRTRPQEQKFYIEYPKNIVLEAFYIDDRAYYPTENFYKN